MATRALIRLPETIRRGDVVTVSLLVQHPMETGYRTGSDGARMPRELIRRVECSFEGQPVFAADLHAAIAANPYIAFPLRVRGAGTLVATWLGDRGFAHRETFRVEVA